VSGSDAEMVEIEMLRDKSFKISMTNDPTADSQWEFGISRTSHKVNRWCSPEDARGCDDGHWEYDG
jgi:hypothetical protein